jgi:ribose transport system ATP-binding protein
MRHLAVHDLVMQFPAVTALDSVSIEFAPGQVHGVIGENGAGKSTLMRILSGLQLPTSGTIVLDNQPIVLHSVSDALSKGIAMIHQELNLVDELTVAENIFLGREPMRMLRIDSETMKEAARTYLDKVGAQYSPTTRLGSLSLAQKQLVEIAKALSYDASILIMDEPTAVLGDAESVNLFRLISELRASGVTVLYVSHRLAEVEAICDTITVLRDGRLVASLKAGEATQSQLAGHMVGREMHDVYPTKTPTHGDVVLSVNALRGVSFELRAGEILGFAGLVGSGRTELGEAIAGLRDTPSNVTVNGKPQVITAPHDAARLGIAYVSEDRKDAGLHLLLDCVANATLANLDNYCRPIVNRRAEVNATNHWVNALDIRAGDINAPILFLSGGNQQKVSIAKWLDRKPKVLILDEPTRGVDVGAKQELYRLIHQLAADGMACIVISSELPEVIGLCHRILVMRNGSLAGEVSGDATEEQIMMLAAGVSAA